MQRVQRYSDVVDARRTGGQARLAARGAAAGAPACLAILAGSVALALLAPPGMLLLTVLLGGLAVGRLLPGVFRPLLRGRWLLLAALLVVPSIFWGGPLDSSLWGLAYSSDGLMAAAHALLRMGVILLGVSVFTSLMEISALAAVFERWGLHGLGFSIGVALNLLPGLQQSAAVTWRVLQMRGGLRRQRWNGLRLLLLNVITQSLNRAEEIALAAEVRAFTPEKAQGYPIPRGSLDGWIVAGCGLLVLAAVLVRMIG